MIASFYKLICLFALMLAISVQARKVDPKFNDKCSVELEGIIFRPKTCAFEYLKRLEVKFRAEGKHVFFTSQAPSFYKSFVNTYAIGVHVANPFGTTTNYYTDGTVSEETIFVYADTAQSYINFPGFVRQISNSNFYYTFPVFSSDGQYLGITFVMELANDPIFC